MQNSDNLVERCTIYTRDRTALAALLYQPPDMSSSRSVVVFLHGFAAEKTENGLFPPLATALVRQNYRVLLYDARGLGESDGDFARSVLSDHVSDFGDVVRWIEVNQGAASQSVSAVGFSLGATLVALAIGEGVRLARSVLLSPALRPSMDMWPRYDLPEHHSELRRKGYISKGNVRVSRRFLYSLRDIDLAPDWQFSLPVPLLVCHGTSDARIPFATSQRVFAVPRPGVSFVPFVGATHSFRPWDSHLGTLADQLTNWFSAFCPVAPPTRERGRRSSHQPDSRPSQHDPP